MIKSGCESVLVVVALVWSAARGEDYSGAALPQYGAGGAAVDYGAGVGGGVDSFPPSSVPEDYGLSPDAPAQLDYKYEEEPRGSVDKATKDIIDKVTRKKPQRKMRKSRHRDEPLEVPNKAELIPKNTWRRSRPQLREPLRRRRLPRDRHHLENSQGYYDDRRKALDERDAARRDTTKKNIRKPRDKIVPKQFISDELDPEQDEVFPDRKVKGKFSEGIDERLDVLPNDLEAENEKSRGRGRSDILEGEDESLRGRLRPDVLEGDNERGGGRLPFDVLEGEGERFRGPPELGSHGGRESGLARQPAIGLEADEEEEAQGGRAPYKGKQFRDYSGDYYDLRRAQSIKKKLPTILRRTSTRREPEQEWSSTEREWSSTEREWSTTEHEWRTTEREWRTTEREWRTTEREWSSTEWQWSSSERQRSSQPDPESEPETSPNDLLQLLQTARRASINPLVPEPDTTPAPANVNSRISTPISSTTTTSTPPIIKPKAELSIAERSRLSILKKAQKKENDINSHSKKPPVLLQVTDRMPTVVMVEPRPSEDPWMRAQISLDETPSQLEKVKRLMRQKIVANARSMEDLTKNWDELVCDYIDVSLLKSRVASCRVSTSLLAGTPMLVLLIR